MNKFAARILGLISILIISYLSVALVANIAQLANAADRIYLGLGQPVFWVLIFVFLGLLLAPLVCFYRLPKPLIPPDDVTGPAHEKYLAQLRSRLKTNPRLSSVPLETDQELATGIAKLTTQANTVVKDTASAVFVSTAVMQNGRLDGLIVLATQLRMVWRILNIYHLRPSPRQVFFIYGNVGANVLIADNIQEIEFTEIAAPIVSSIFPSLKGAVPGLQGISTLLVNSLANGAANAFLTLRIGIVTRVYCEATSLPLRSKVRQSATLAALLLVKDIAKEQGARVVKSAWNVLRGTVETSIDSTYQVAKGAVNKAGEVTVETAKSVGKTFDKTLGKVKESTGKVIFRKST